MKHCRPLIFFFSMFVSGLLIAQSNISIKANSLGYSFLNSKNVSLYKTAFDGNGKLLLEPGVILTYDNYITEDYFSFKIEQGIFSDRVGLMAGYTSIGLRRKILNSYRSSFNISIGPALFFRKSWSQFPAYKNENNMLEKKGYEYKFQVITGEIEYNLQLGSSNADFSASIKYFQPYTINPAIGFRYWFNKKIRKKRGCISCPAFHK